MAKIVKNTENEDGIYWANLLAQYCHSKIDDGHVLQDEIDIFENIATYEKYYKIISNHTIYLEHGNQPKRDCNQAFYFLQGNIYELDVSGSHRHKIASKVYVCYPK